MQFVMVFSNAVGQWIKALLMKATQLIGTSRDEATRVVRC